MLQFANAFCRKGPLNVMHDFCCSACCVSFPVTGCPESKIVLFKEEALYFKV